MTGFATFSALLPLLMATWRISNSEAGTISGVYYAGYMAAVLLLTGMTDRVECSPHLSVSACRRSLPCTHVFRKRRACL
jgi:fucose permease